MRKRLICLVLAICVLGTCGWAETVTLRVNTAFDSEMDIDIAFDEALFMKNAYEYDHRLMQATMVLSQAAVAANDAYGEDGDFNRERYALDAYVRLGFSDARAWNFECSLNDPSDKAAFTIGRKALSDGSALYLILVRSANYGSEWVSNFHVGAGDTHAGFTGAAQGVVRAFHEYIAEFPPEGRAKIWITGYSRGAAVSNVTAALLDDCASAGNEPFSPEDIFAYTFATPATAKIESAGAEDALYGNIYNLVSVCDIVPEMPLPKWGYTRFGNTLTFGTVDAALTDEEALEELSGPVKTYSALTDTLFDIAAFRALPEKKNGILVSMRAIVPTAQDYADTWETLFMRFMRVSNAKLRRDSLSRDTLDALSGTYAGQDWAAYALSQYEKLSETAWSADAFLSLLSLYGDTGAQAASRASAMAAALAGKAGEAYNIALSYITLAMMSAEEAARQTGENEYALVGRYLPMLVTLAGLPEIFAGHMPDAYIALLTSQSEDQLWG